jgi:hypothetical protein
MRQAYLMLRCNAVSLAVPADQGGPVCVRENICRTVRGIRLAEAIASQNWSVAASTAVASDAPRLLLFPLDVTQL